MVREFRIGDKVTYDGYMYTIMAHDNSVKIARSYLIYRDSLLGWTWAKSHKLTLVEPVITFTECKWEDLQVWDVFYDGEKLCYKNSDNIHISMRNSEPSWSTAIYSTVYKVNGVNILSIIQNVIGDAKP